MPAESSATHFAQPVRLNCGKNPGSRSLRDKCFASLFLAETVSLTLGELGSSKILRPELRCCKYAASTRPFVVCLSVATLIFLRILYVLLHNYNFSQNIPQTNLLHLNFFFSKSLKIYYILFRHMVVVIQTIP